MYTVKGKKVLIFGDDHFEDVFKGKHLNYYQNSLNCGYKRNEIQSREKADLIICTGDFIGVRSGVSSVKDREMLFQIIMYLKSFNCPVIINRGNHDLFGDIHSNDYDLLSRLGYFISPESFEDENGCIVRMDTGVSEDDYYFHIVPYGYETRPLKPVKGAINIAVTHNDFRIGEQYFTNNRDAYDLKTHQAFFGVDVVLNGHIHEPTDNTYSYTTIVGGNGVFMNLGCMARPTIKENYSHCWYAKFDIEVNDGEENTLKFEPVAIELEKLENVFDLSKPLTELVREELANEERQLQLDNLDGVFDELREMQWGGVSILDRVETLSIDDEVKKVMVYYLQNS